MLCQQCAEEASFHLTELVDGKKREVHLCAACARGSGFNVDVELNVSGKEGVHASASGLMGLIESVVQFMVKNQLGEKAGVIVSASCPICGLGFSDFRDTGRLGCPHDYEALAEGLTQLIQRNQGTTRHVGKVPGRGPSGADRLRMRAKLRAAVDREDYEEAAKWRDELRRKDAVR